jgi:hypothetical protein
MTRIVSSRGISPPSTPSPGKSTEDIFYDFYFFWNFRFWENARHNFFDETSCETLAWSKQGKEVQPFQRKRKTAIIVVQLF